MLPELFIVVGVLGIYFCIAMGLHRWCDHKELNNYLSYQDTYGNDYSLIE